MATKKNKQSEESKPKPEPKTGAKQKATSAKGASTAKPKPKTGSKPKTATAKSATATKPKTSPKPKATSKPKTTPKPKTAPKQKAAPKPKAPPEHRLIRYIRGNIEIGGIDTKRERRLTYALSFAMPFLILGVIFALTDIYPFGNRQVLIVDFWQQYFPFITDYTDKLSGGSSLLWSWRIGIGGEYLGHVAFLLSSPFNLLLLLFPQESHREVLTLFILIKIGLAGLFAAKFLLVTTKRNKLILPLLSTTYALCAWSVGYYSNIMWLDAFALAPLVVLGVYSLYFNKRYKLYVISLALAILTNYMMGYFLCAYVAITFFTLCIIHKPGLRDFGKKLAQIAGYSCIAAGITAVLTLPAFISLQSTYAVTDSFPTKTTFYRSFFDVLGNFIAFTPATSRDGLPNLYSGMITLMLAAVFVRSKRIVLREKIVFLVFIVFLVISSNQNTLTYIWHGFNFPNMLPARFSFLLSLLLVITAFRVYEMMEEVDNKDILIMGATGAFFITMAVLGERSLLEVVGAIVLCVLYMIIFFFIVNIKMKQSYIFHIALFILIIAEVSGSAYVGISDMGNTSRDNYPPHNLAIRGLLEQREIDETGFYRTELTERQTLNAPQLYGYDGISVFSSSVDARTTEFLRGIGIPVWTEGGRYYFAETTPVTSMFLNLRYLMSVDGKPADGSYFWHNAGTSGNALLLESSHYLPLGFMVDEEILGYSRDNSDNPFLLQNELFSRATGLDGELFTFIDTKNRGHSGYDTSRKRLGEYTYTRNDDAQDGYLKWNYDIPGGSVIYAYCDVTGNDSIRVTVSGETLRTIENRRRYIFTAGSFEEDTLLSLFADIDRAGGNARMYVAQIDRDLFWRGYYTLADETLELTKFTDTHIEGQVTAMTDGLLYTSIPYDGNWQAFVNGERAEVLTLDGCMLMLRLDAGEHEISLRYRNSSVAWGAVITVLSLAVFTLLVTKPWEIRTSLLPCL